MHDVLDHLIGILFPGCHGHGPLARTHGTVDLARELAHAVRTLTQQAQRALHRLQMVLNRARL